MLWLIFPLLLAAQEGPVVEGDRALEAKNYPAAIASFKAAAEKNPQNHEILFNLALAYSLNNQDELAADTYESVLRLKPGLYAAELNLGVLLYSSKPEAALPHLEAARKEKPAEFSPAFHLGEAFFRLQRFAEAEAHYAAAAATDPKSPHAWIGLARTDLRLGRDEDARAHYEKAVEADSRFAPAILELAAYYEVKGQDESALAVYSRFPEDLKAREKIGATLVRLGRFADAIPHLEYAFLKVPGVASLLPLSQAYFKTGQADKGLALLKQAILAQPQDFDLRMLLGKTLRDNHNYQVAIGEYAAAARIKPDSQDAWSELANTQILIESFEQALYSLDKVKALGPEKEGHLFLRALALDKLRLYEPALQSYQQFLSMAGGKYPNQEFQARQRSRIIKTILSKR